MPRLAILALAVLLSACAAFTAGPPAPRAYRLNYAPPAPAYDAPAGIVRVAPFSIAPPYDRLGFIYREGPYDVGVDNYNSWASAPGAMIADLIARDLGSARVAAAVLQGPSALAPDYELGGRVEEIDEVDDGGCTAHLRLRVLLTRIGASGPRGPVFEEVFASEQPCELGDPTSFAAAMSRAVADVSAQVAARVATVR
jgi:uncharacterized lipoprotein YmbA